MTVPGGLDDVTLGEVVRSLVALEQRINSKFDELANGLKDSTAHVNERFDQLQYVHKDTYRAEAAATLQRLEALEERSKWVTRALAGIPFAAAGAAAAAMIVSAI